MGYVRGASMTVCVNGKRRQISDGVTVQNLVEGFKLKQKSVVVELNHKVIERNLLASTELRENDILEIVQFVGGG
jgi:sulfur carrier protein